VAIKKKMGGKKEGTDGDRNEEDRKMGGRNDGRIKEKQKRR
jgi:hypothetical protein